MSNEILKNTRLRDARNRRRITQTDLARILNVSQNTISQYENSDRNMPNDTLIKLALLYETSIDYLVGLTDDNIPYSRSRIFQLPKDFGPRTFLDK